MKTKFTFLIFFLTTVIIYSDVRLPKLISDGMVLQRDAKVKIWGWADPREEIKIDFLGSQFNTTADDNGDWNIILSDLEAGGPYVMKIDGKNSITVNDIVIGDVWVCSGQSNMELTIERASPVYRIEIASCENDFIRHFEVPDKYNFNYPEKDLESGNWVKVNPETILKFSAVGYFFAKEIYDKYKIPVGLINSALGGSPAEAWMSEEALKQFPEYYSEAQKFKVSSLIDSIESADQKRIGVWHSSLWQKDEGYKDPANPWYEPSLNTAGWNGMEIPSYWTNTELENVDGVVWFRKKINVPSAMTDKPAKLLLGRIIDADSVFVNGEFVGTTGYQWPPRRYNVPSGLLNEGENVIVVRIINSSGAGGFVPEKEYSLKNEEDSIDLSGEWLYKIGAEMEPLAGQTFIRWKPLGLYNAMIAPLLHFKIRGVIWYQGEANTFKAVEYRELFPELIKDWRKNWNQGDFPFFFVQLTSFMEVKNQPSESNWAMLRESQLKSLSVPRTGMAVTIDIGEANDIHPLNKKDVGKRLFLAAQKIAYGEDVVYSGPVYKSMIKDGNKIIISFTNTGSGLITKDGNELRYFTIAGADKNFVWAKAEIKGDKVVVWNDNISDPIAVRYAWADNPEGANLYNKEGLPASPFRTDNFGEENKLKSLK